MPVTAKLSRKFYERLGDDVANELVEWFNSVDTAYRQEFRDLFEAHFGRFEARLQQGMAELRREIEANNGKLIAWSFGFWVAQFVAILTILKLAGVL